MRFTRILTVLFAAGVAFTGAAQVSHAASGQGKAVASKARSKAVAVKKGPEKKVKAKRATARRSKTIYVTIGPRAGKRVVAKAPREVRIADEPDFDQAGNPLIRSSAFVVQDLNSGQILLEKNSAAAVPIASITKLMTSMVVLDAHQDLNELIDVSDEDVDRLKGTSSHVPVGTRLTREEMMRLALMASENRAAASLGRHYPGGMVAFLAAMNDKARSLGLKETRFHDGTGLNKHNVSSARDLAILVASASRYPLIREFSTASEYAVNLNGRPRLFRNTNALVRNADWQIGVSKTGFINESGKCLVMQAWLANKPVAIVLLDSWGRFTRLGDANRIRKWVETALAQQKIAAAATAAIVAN